MVSLPFDPMRLAMPTHRHEMVVGGDLVAGFNPIYAILSGYHAALDALETHPAAFDSEWARDERTRLHRAAERELLPFGCPPIGCVFTAEQVAKHAAWNDWVHNKTGAPTASSEVPDAPLTAPAQTVPVDAPGKSGGKRNSLAHLSPDERAAYDNAKQREYKTRYAAKRKAEKETDHADVSSSTLAHVQTECEVQADQNAEPQRDAGAQGQVFLHDARDQEQNAASLSVVLAKPKRQSLAHLTDEEKREHKLAQMRASQARKREKGKNSPTPAEQRASTKAKKDAVLAQETAELDALPPQKVSDATHEGDNDAEQGEDDAKAAPRFALPIPAKKRTEAETLAAVQSLADLHKRAVVTFAATGYDVHIRAHDGELKTVRRAEKPQIGWYAQSRHWKNGLNQWHERKLTRDGQEVRP